jgi:drug/metabolite transporter (DMT)-like permease
MRRRRSSPVFAVLAAAAFGTERLTVHRLGGALTGLLGVAVLAGPALPAAGPELLGIALCLGACLSYGLAGVWAGRVRRAGLEPLPAAAGQCALSALVMIPLVLAFDRPWALPVPPAEAVAALVGFGLV